MEEVRLGEKREQAQSHPRASLSDQTGDRVPEQGLEPGRSSQWRSEPRRAGEEPEKDVYVLGLHTPTAPATHQASLHGVVQHGVDTGLL